ncbi:hypothetical protein Ancab_010624 [Ancistrocladus abbreviatus]
MTELCLLMSLFERGNSESEFRRRRVGEPAFVEEVAPFVGDALGPVRFVLGPSAPSVAAAVGALLFCVRSGVATLPGPTAFKDFLGLARKSFGAVRLVSVSFLI